MLSESLSVMEILEKRIHKILARISNVADFRRIAADILRGDTEAAVSGLVRKRPRPLYCGSVAISAPASDRRYAAGSWRRRVDHRYCVLPRRTEFRRLQSRMSVSRMGDGSYAGLTPHADIQQARATTLWRLETSTSISSSAPSGRSRPGLSHLPISIRTACAFRAGDDLVAGTADRTPRQRRVLATGASWRARRIFGSGRNRRCVFAADEESRAN